MSAKQALRLRIARSLQLLDAETLRAQSERTARALSDLAAYQQSETVAFYMHMDYGELQTGAMIANAFKDKKRVFLPHIVKYAAEENHSWFPTQKMHLKMLEVPNLNAVNSLEPRGKFKLKEPTSGFNALYDGAAGLDLIVLPGVGFTEDGGRMGHGAGFYDSFIAEHERMTGRTPTTIGVGLSEQLITPSTDLPLEAHDRRLDYVIIDGVVYHGDQKNSRTSD